MVTCLIGYSNCNNCERTTSREAKVRHDRLLQVLRNSQCQKVFSMCVHRFQSGRQVVTKRINRVGGGQPIKSPRADAPSQFPGNEWCAEFALLSVCGVMADVSGYALVDAPPG
jgi:hypothetical protein